MSQPAHLRDNNMLPLQSQTLRSSADGMCMSTCTSLVPTCFFFFQKGRRDTDEKRKGVVSKADNISAGGEEPASAAETDEEEEEGLRRESSLRLLCCLRRSSSLEPRLRMLVMLMKMKASTEHAQQQPHVPERTIILMMRSGTVHEVRAHV